MKRFRTAVESADADAIVASLAPDIEFHSPIAFKPYRGREQVGRLLRAVLQVFRDFRYTDELKSERQTALVFTARVGDHHIEGIDLAEVDADGLLTKLVVFVRPLSAALAFAEAMKAILEKR